MDVFACVPVDLTGSARDLRQFDQRGRIAINVIMALDPAKGGAVAVFGDLAGGIAEFVPGLRPVFRVVTGLFHQLLVEPVAGVILAEAEQREAVQSPLVGGVTLDEGFRWQGVDPAFGRIAFQRREPAFGHQHHAATIKTG